MPRRQPRRARLWLNDGSCVRLTDAEPPHRWAKAPPGEIVCAERLGGLLRHYYRAAA